MPHLQLDVPSYYPAQVKRDLAKRFGDLYADHMQTTADLVDVTFREGEASVWHCSRDTEPVGAAVLTLDIRRGRPPEQRARLAKALIDACASALGLDPLVMSCEFTQHPGDEVYRDILVDGVMYGGLAKDWSPEEVETPLIDTIGAEKRAKAEHLA
jgi:phenylpyruvate tautomerase PptA (4-oxalocrotonate tautomerase family)